VPECHRLVTWPDYFTTVFCVTYILHKLYIHMAPLLSADLQSCMFLHSLSRTEHSKFFLSLPYIFWTSLTFSPGSLESVGLYILTTIRLVAWILPSGDFFLWSRSCFSPFRLWSNATNWNTYSSLLIQYIRFSQDFASFRIRKQNVHRSQQQEKKSWTSSRKFGGCL
jgi:hypothetical protein